MKNSVLSSLLVLLITSVLFSCKSNTKPVVDYLHVSKINGVLFDEVLTVKATASDEDEDVLVYTWQCTGGTITGVGANVTWTAPAQVGTYTITVNVSDGEETISLSKNVEVVGEYSFSFSQSSPVWSYSTYCSRVIAGGQFTIASTDSIVYAEYGYNAETDIPLPFSIKTKIAVNADNIFPATSPRIQLNLNFTTLTGVDSYLKTLMLYIYPTANTWQLRSRVADLNAGSNIYQNVAIDSYSDSKAIFTESNQYHTLGLAISVDKKLTITLDGQEMYSTMALATEPAYSREIRLSSFSYSVAPGLKLLADDFCLTTDATILK